MYLFAFMFLLFSLLGIYTQVSAIQAAKFFANQTAIGQHMIDWHVTAVALARTMTFTSTVYPCSLSTAGSCGGQSVASSGLLPSGDSGNYIWLSMVFVPTNTSARYVATYVRPAPLDVDATTKAIVSPAIGLTLDELALQLKNAKLSPSLFGLVTASGTNHILSSRAGTDLPVDATIPVNSLAIISRIP